MVCLKQQLPVRVSLRGPVPLRAPLMISRGSTGSEPMFAIFVKGKPYD